MDTTSALLACFPILTFDKQNAMGKKTGKVGSLIRIIDESNAYEYYHQ